MKRRTLDLVFSVGGLLLAILILVLGLVLNNQANFAKNYVHDQMAQQRISFTPAKFLAADENAPCLKKWAGKPLLTGKQAECYANNYIGLHVKAINDGKTYSETSTQARNLQKQLDALPNQNSPEAKKLAADVAKAEGQADTLFKGESLRGLLLTSYGFSIFGERAGQAAMVCFAVAAVLLLAALAGFVHASTKSAEHLVIPPVEE